MSRSVAGRLEAWVYTSVLTGVALLSVFLGSESSRRREEPRELGGEILRRSLESGSEASEVRAALLDLRTRIGRHPLEARARASYAALLLALSQRTDEAEAAAFHARRAAALAPVTVPVVRLSALVLTQAGQSEEALRLVRAMFDYEPERAARLLDRLASSVDPDQIEYGIPETSRAWLAWSRQLAEGGRKDEAEQRLAASVRLWPEDLDVWVAAGAAAVERRDRARLRDLFPPTRPIPSGSRAAPLLLQRAWSEALDGRSEDAARTTEQALDLAERDRWIRLLAGDVFWTLGASERCRSLWSGVLHETSRADDVYLRKETLRRLGRLEDRFGTPSAALRAWRSLAALSPEDPEARARIEPR